MLLHMMELKGKVNHRMIKKAQFGNVHFDEGMNFLSCELDKATGQVRLPPCSFRFPYRHSKWLTFSPPLCSCFLLQIELHKSPALLEAYAGPARATDAVRSGPVKDEGRRAQVSDVVHRLDRPVSRARPG